MLETCSVLDDGVIIVDGVGEVDIDPPTPVPPLTTAINFLSNEFLAFVIFALIDVLELNDGEFLIFDDNNDDDCNCDCDEPTIFIGTVQESLNDAERWTCTELEWEFNNNNEDDDDDEVVCCCLLLLSCVAAVVDPIVCW